jgi:predicted RNA-binding Zn-ribbon protein involved in translation (DUF1610 family)
MNRKLGDNTSPILLTDEISNLRSTHQTPTLAPLTIDATIRCPFCSEHILASAKKCKHYGEFLYERDATNATGIAPPPRVRRQGDMICPNPNCRYEGPPRKVARGSVLVGILLLLFFLLPGILYFIFMTGYRYDCPKCGLQIKSDKVIASLFGIALIAVASIGGLAWYGSHWLPPPVIAPYPMTATCQAKFNMTTSMAQVRDAGVSREVELKMIEDRDLPLVVKFFAVQQVIRVYNNPTMTPMQLGLSIDGCK